MKLACGLAVGCTLAALAPPLRAQEQSTNELIQALLGDSAEYRKVITGFQAAVKAHNAPGVAAVIAYPITVRIQGTKRTIRTEQVFVAKYDSIITPEIAAAVQDEAYDSLFVNAKGVMLGRGEVWFNTVCSNLHCSPAATVRVITIQQTSSGR